VLLLEMLSMKTQWAVLGAIFCRFETLLPVSSYSSGATHCEKISISGFRETTKLHNHAPPKHWNLTVSYHGATC